MRTRGAATCLIGLYMLLLATDAKWFDRERRDASSRWGPWSGPTSSTSASAGECGFTEISDGQPQYRPCTTSTPSSVVYTSASPSSPSSSTSSTSSGAVDSATSSAQSNEPTTSTTTPTSSPSTTTPTSSTSTATPTSSPSTTTQTAESTSTSTSTSSSAFSSNAQSSPTSANSSPSSSPSSTTTSTVATSEASTSPSAQESAMSSTTNLSGLSSSTTSPEPSSVTSTSTISSSLQSTTSSTPSSGELTTSSGQPSSPSSVISTATSAASTNAPLSNASSQGTTLSSTSEASSLTSSPSSRQSTTTSSSTTAASSEGGPIVSTSPSSSSTSTAISPSLSSVAPSGESTSTVLKSTSPFSSTAVAASSVQVSTSTLVETISSTVSQSQTTFTTVIVTTIITQISSTIESLAAPSSSSTTSSGFSSAASPGSSPSGPTASPPSSPVPGASAMPVSWVSATSLTSQLSCENGAIPWCASLPLATETKVGCLCPYCVWGNPLLCASPPTNTNSCPDGWLCSVTLPSDTSTAWLSLPTGISWGTPAASSTWNITRKSITATQGTSTTTIEFDASLRTSTISGNDGSETLIPFRIWGCQGPLCASLNNGAGGIVGAVECALHVKDDCKPKGINGYPIPKIPYPPPDGPSSLLSELSITIVKPSATEGPSPSGSTGASENTGSASSSSSCSASEVGVCSTICPAPTSGTSIASESCSTTCDSTSACSVTGSSTTTTESAAACSISPYWNNPNVSMSIESWISEFSFSISWNSTSLTQPTTTPSTLSSTRSTTATSPSATSTVSISPLPSAPTHSSISTEPVPPLATPISALQSSCQKWIPPYSRSAKPSPYLASDDPNHVNLICATNPTATSTTGLPANTPSIFPLPSPWPTNEKFQWFRDDLGVTTAVCQDLVDRQIIIRQDPTGQFSNKNSSNGECATWDGPTNDPLAMNGFNVTYGVVWDEENGETCLRDTPAPITVDFSEKGVQYCVDAFSQVINQCGQKPPGEFAPYLDIGGQYWNDCLQWTVIAAVNPPSDTDANPVGIGEAEILRHATLSDGAHEV